jgi:Holliday junction resolvase RusA-like endonuclease
LRTLTFSILGVAAPAGSKRGYARGGHVQIVEDSKRTEPWKLEVARAGIDAMREHGFEPRSFLGPLDLFVVFRFVRPKSHYGTGRNAERLKTSAPQHHVVKPDTTKLVRALEDALTGVVWRDDAQVVIQHAVKSYALRGESACARVSITEVP